MNPAVYSLRTYALGSGALNTENAEIAIEAAQCLLGNKPEHEEMWRDAVAKIQWQGRMEECADHFIIDGAHNP